MLRSILRLSNYKLLKLALLVIILIAAILRLYKLDQIPPSLNWDEVAAGYNAYTIANFGKDEWGKVLPLSFRSFEDDKHPVHIYITSLFVKLFGLSDFTTRLPGAVVGIISVYVIFYLAQILFKSNLAALLSALFLAVSPYHIHFSRGLWEVNFATLFFMLGLLMFYLGLQKKGWLLNIAFLSFGLSLISYHSSKIIVPPIVLILTIFYFRNLKKLSLNFYSGLLIFLTFVILLFIDPKLLGTARAKQTQFERDVIEKTQVYQRTKNHLLGLSEITLRQYLTHFTPEYLFLSGDQSPRNSVKIHGEFYKVDALFILIGLIYLLKLKSKITLVLMTWLLLSPIPSSFVKGVPSATRAIFMMGSLHLIAGLGAGTILGWFKGKGKSVGLGIIIVLLSAQVYSYLNYYFKAYPLKDPHEWQYGMKQIVEYVKDHQDYIQVYTTDVRSQPYIFFLYYLKTPLPRFLETVSFTQDIERRKYSMVSFFDRYHFGDWDPIESYPHLGVLYVVTPSQYDGLRHRSEFEVKKIIYYPDGGTDFYLVSKN